MYRLAKANSAASWKYGHCTWLELNNALLCCIQVKSPDQRVPGLYAKLRRSLASFSASDMTKTFFPTSLANERPINASIRASFVSCREK